VNVFTDSEKVLVC